MQTGVYRTDRIFVILFSYSAVKYPIDTAGIERYHQPPHFKAITIPQYKAINRLRTMPVRRQSDVDINADR